MTDTARDDLELLRACSNGDEQALGSLYDRYGTVAYGVALRVLGKPGLAEEAVHDAFVTLWRHAASYDRARGTASAWILALVHRRAVDLRRDCGLDALRVELRPRGPVERVHEVQAALRTLSHAEREVLTLAYWGGLTQSEIAARLRIPLATVRTWTRDALVKLRDALDHTGTPWPESLPGAVRS